LREGERAEQRGGPWRQSNFRHLLTTTTLTTMTHEPLPPTTHPSPLHHYGTRNPPAHPSPPHHYDTRNPSAVAHLLHPRDGGLRRFACKNAREAGACRRRARRAIGLRRPQLRPQIRHLRGHHAPTARRVNPRSSRSLGPQCRANTTHVCVLSRPASADPDHLVYCHMSRAGPSPSSGQDFFVMRCSQSLMRELLYAPAAACGAT
jgi:hypothetical protein